MGLPMNNIHDPTIVPSGPSSRPSASNGAPQDKVPLMDLIAEKSRVEEELKALGSVLDSHNVNMNTPLTTFDGYPRDDIDVAQIRTTRARIIHLKTDFKSLMSRIETGLHDHHASFTAQNLTSSTAATSSTSTLPNRTHQPAAVATAARDRSLVETPFAKVNSVERGGPADEAGLKAGDWIRRFGEVNWMNHEKLRKVAEVVRSQKGRAVTVKVIRTGEAPGEDQELVLSLTPREGWGGNGLLGCHLLPV